jgi:hypothetical protein
VRLGRAYVVTRVIRGTSEEGEEVITEVVRGVASLGGV